jgi:hypothetical protein
MGWDRRAPLRKVKKGRASTCKMAAASFMDIPHPGVNKGITAKECLSGAVIPRIAAAALWSALHHKPPPSSWKARVLSWVTPFCMHVLFSLYSGKMSVQCATAWKPHNESAKKCHRIPGCVHNAITR